MRRRRGLFARCSARRTRARPRRRSPGPFASCSSRPRNSGRSSASLTTCTGARRHSWIWSNMSPICPALLAARLDQLEPAERSVLERGAIEGQVFHESAVQALSDDEARLSARLIALVRKDLVRPERSEVPGEDAYRFRHVLIRDAAYDA